MNKRTLSYTAFAVLILLLISACGSLPALSLSRLTNQLDRNNSSSETSPSAQQDQAPTKLPAQKPTQASANPPSNAPSGSENELLAAYEGTLENVYASVGPSVVNIRVVQNQPKGYSDNNSGDQQFPFTFPFDIPGLPNGNDQGQQQNQQPYSEALGSGFVWDTEGHIVTNNHVVDGADKIEVTFSDGTIVPATRVGVDPDSDLAVIKVDASKDLLKPVALADSDQVKVGQMAIAIGNPFGLQGTMTVGIVSALERSLSSTRTTENGSGYSIPDIIQTDAPINPGNSGGVLVNNQGQVIGVTSAIESTSNSNAGIGFAIPSKMVQQVVPSLIAKGTYEHPYLGISGTNLTPDLAKAMKLDSGARGALVEEVVQGGPADKAGLQASSDTVTVDGQEIQVGGDVIIKIEDESVQTMDDIISYLADSTKVGQTVTLTVLRNGKEKSIEVTLTARPGITQAQPTHQETPQAQSGKPWLGIQGMDLSKEINKAMALDEDQKGVLVEQVEDNSPADQAGLKGSFKSITISGQQVQVGGDVIVGFNDAEINTIQDLSKAVAKANPGDTVKLSILRDGQSQEVTVTLGSRDQ
jgi:S1-C subfamily serine protease